MTTPSRETLAYIAGYIDGEGCIGYYNSKPTIYIESCNPASMRFISSFFGGNVRERTRKSKSGRAVYRLAYTCNKALALLDEIEDFLLEKQTQARNVRLMNELHKQITKDKKQSH
jgi:hypothetical protein